MTRADAKALIAKALRGDVLAAIAAKREQPNHDVDDWSAMNQEVLHAEAGGRLEIRWPGGASEEDAERQEACERALAKKGGSVELTRRIAKLGGRITRVRADVRGAHTAEASYWRTR